MKKIRLHHLSTRLAIVILVLAAPLFITTIGALFLEARQVIRHKAVGRAKSALNASMQRLDRNLLAVQTATEAYSWVLEEQLHPDSFLTLSHKVVALNPHIDGCSVSAEPYLFPEKGRHYSVYTVREPDSVRTVVEEEYEYFQKTWYKLPYDLNEPCWEIYFDEADSLELTIDGMLASYGKPLHNAKNEIVGVISTDLSLLKLTKIINEERPYPNSYYLFIGGDGRYVIYPDSARLCKKNVYSESCQKYSMLDALDHKMTAGHQGTIHTAIDGKLSHVCYTPIPNTNWSLALISPDSEVLTNYHQLVNIIVVLIIIGLVVILWLCYHVVHQTIRPINKLLTLSEKIIDGNYDERIPHSPREDAIGKLQNSFSIMQQSLYKYVGSIRMKAKETQLRNEELAEAMKLVEEGVRKKEVFIQNVSHQMRTPLNIILGFADVLRDSLLARDNGQDTLKEEELVNITNTMKYNSMHLNRMVLMLFDSSEQGAGGKIFNLRKEEVSCNAAAREAIDYAQTHFPQQTVHFETALPDNFRILTNELYLTHMLGELLYNAGKFSDGQHTSLHISETPTSVIFTIEDQGPGLPPGQENTIFKPFVKVNDLSEGLGLGLPLAKRHALNLDGDLYYDATYRDGCRFIVEMPK